MMILKRLIMLLIAWLQNLVWINKWDILLFLMHNISNPMAKKQKH